MGGLPTPVIIVASLLLFIAGYGVGLCKRDAAQSTYMAVSHDQCPPICTNLIEILNTTTEQIHYSLHNLSHNNTQQENLLHDLYRRTERLNDTFNESIAHMSALINRTFSHSRDNDDQMKKTLLDTKEELILLKNDLDIKREQFEVDLMKQVQKHLTGLREEIFVRVHQFESAQNELANVLEAVQTIQLKNERISEHLTDIGDKQVEVSSHSEQQKADLQEFIKDLLSRQSLHPPSAGENDILSDTVFYLLVSWIINILLLVVGYMYVVSRNQSDWTQPNTGQEGNEPGRNKLVPVGEKRRMERRGPPSCGLSVIAFSESTLDDARNIIRTASRDLGITLPTYHALKGAADLVDVPVSRSYLVVIGYDGRDAILEDMDGYQGSRKRDTVEALQRTGGEVVVVYMDNDTSSELPPGDALYHPRLGQAETHPVLLPIVSNENFYAIHRGKLTNYQANRIKDWLKKTSL